MKSNPYIYTVNQNYKMKKQEQNTSSNVICPHCGQVDVEKTYWVTEMPFCKYTIQCGKCKRAFKCSVNDAGEINSFVVGGKCNDKNIYYESK